MTQREIDRMLGVKPEKSGWGIAWQVTKFIGGAAWCSTKFVAKNTPAALGMAWEIKKEISQEIAKGIHEARKEQKALALDQEIKMLKGKS
jgi:hypothetical protein